MSNQRGMSLIEVLVTVVIIGIVFLLLSQSMDFFTTARAIHAEKKEAVFIAEEQLAKQLDRLNEGRSISDHYVLGKYLITLHTRELSEGTAFSTPDLSHHISMSGMYDNEGEPRLLTITVSWGN